VSASSSPGADLITGRAPSAPVTAPAAAPAPAPSPEGLIAGLKALAHDALELDDDEALESLRALIKRRKAGAASLAPAAEPAAPDATVVSLDEARRRTR
jgi:hypothetical protein